MAVFAAKVHIFVVTNGAVVEAETRRPVLDTVLRILLLSIQIEAINSVRRLSVQLKAFGLPK